MSVQHDFYTARAAEARAAAERAELDNVRERCLRSASAWQLMADRAFRTEALRERNEERKKAETES